MDRTLSLMLVFFGGGFGCLVRYLTAPDPNFPFTFANISACLIIGGIYAFTRYKVFTNIYAQAFVTVGFLGGLSTFTPLATYAIVQSEPTFILSFLWFIVYLAAFFAISVIGYIPSALYCRKVLHLQAVPSIAAIARTHHHKRQAQHDAKIQEQNMQQYAKMLKEMLEAKDMLMKLKESTETLGRLAKVSPQAAKEYAQAKAALEKFQTTLQQQQQILAALDPMQGMAPQGLTPAPGFKEPDAKQNADRAANQSSALLPDNVTNAAQATAYSNDSSSSESKEKKL